MAVVYAAKKVGGDAVIALKRPMPWPNCDERLMREIDVLRQLDHPHVMPILDHGLDEDGRPWYAMPRARGSLQDLWESGALGNDAQAVCTDVLDEVCSGLGAMHEAGFLHRDVTYRNVLALHDADVPRGYRWVIADCGLVRRPLGETTHGLTGSATSLGTLGFIAPEGFGNPHDLTAAADVYGLGRILAWLLTGEKPELTKQLLPTGAWRAVVRAFTRDDPLDRPQSTSAARSKAHELLAGVPISEKADFRNQIREHGGNLRPDNRLWTVVRDHLDDYNFMVDDLVTIEPGAARRLATTHPETAALIGERLAAHLCNESEYGSRQWDALVAHLGWIKAVLEGLDEADRSDLFEDVALVYCRAVRTWDRYRHSDVLRPWLSRLTGQCGDAMATAIHQSGETAYFRAVMEGRPLANPAMRALLQD